MNIIESMIEKLSVFAVYNLEKENSLVLAELNAYKKGLDMIKENLDELERECFLSTAQSYGLDIRERAFTSKKDDLPFEERREMLKYRYSITSNDFNKTHIEKALISAGIRCYIIENPKRQSIYINCLERFDTTLPQVESQKLAEKFLPAHLSYEFDFRPLQWREIELKDLTFQQIDNFNLTWDEIDNYQED
ncbi:MAG: hypothetical protein IJ758_01975 [Clostridia bacterium]|nr:hypothetical protein [Clostridia bacterium]